MRKKPGKKWALPAAVILLLCLILPGLNNELRVVHYHLDSGKVSTPIRIALVTDLHCCAYGEDQRTLLEALEQENPDLILLGGDIFDDDLPLDNTVLFLRGISGKYPCYYVTGNHEYWRGEAEFPKLNAILLEYGIHRLCGETATVAIRGERIRICGVDDPFAWENPGGFSEYTSGSFREQVARVAADPEDNLYTILLTHRPEELALYARYGFDLVCAGHAHGGQWRIPGLLNGLYTPDQGFFPTLAGGQYEQDGTTMIVSRGLARESTRIPRFYNRPELVIIDVD